MEPENLIKAVCKRPPIWYRTGSGKDYYNRSVTEKMWNEISTEMKESKDKIKKKWKGLRDTFRFEFKKYVLRISNNPNKNLVQLEPSWPYFRALYFLKDHVNIKVPKSIAGNYKGTTKKLVHTNSHNENENFNEWNCFINSFPNQNIEISDDCIDLVSTASPATDHPNKQSPETQNEDENDIKPYVAFEEIDTNSYELNELEETSVTEKLLNDNDDGNGDDRKKKKRKWYEIGEKIIELEYEKINLIKKDNEYKQMREKDKNKSLLAEFDDEDKSFLNSLLPHIKKLQPAKKMKCRMDIQKIVYDYVYNESNTNSK